MRSVEVKRRIVYPRSWNAFELVRSAWNALRVPCASQPSVSTTTRFAGPQEVDTVADDPLRGERTRELVAVADPQKAVLDPGLGQHEVLEEDAQSAARPAAERLLGRREVEAAEELRLAQRADELVVSDLGGEVDESARRGGHGDAAVDSRVAWLEFCAVDRDAGM